MQLIHLQCLEYYQVEYQHTNVALKQDLLHWGMTLVEESVPAVILGHVCNNLVIKFTKNNKTNNEIQGITLYLFFGFFFVLQPFYRHHTSFSPLHHLYLDSPTQLSV